MQKILEKVLKEITPTEEEKIEEKEFSKKLLNKLQKGFPDAEVRIVGSSARDTGLRNDKDLDIFVIFPKIMKKEEIIKKTISRTKKIIRVKWILRYAEHPYLQAIIGKFKVEVVPCFRFRGKGTIASAVDRSPLHMDYLENKLSKKQKSDVKLLKKFIKAAGIYGAEAAIGGFSGLLCEYMVLYYGSFRKVIENASKWKIPVFIDLEGFWSAGKASKKFNAPLIIVDPVDKNRNAGAPVSLTSLSKFIYTCREFLRKPSIKFFFKQKRKIAAKAVWDIIKKRKSSLRMIEFKKVPLIEDTLIPQLRKTEKSIVKKINEKFSVIGSSSFCDEKKCYILLELEFDKKSAVRKMVGPEVTMEKAVEKFLKAHKNVMRSYIAGKHIIVEIRDMYEDLDCMLKNIIKKRKITIGKDIAKNIKKAKIYDAEAIKKNKKIYLLSDYFSKRLLK